MFQRRLEAVQNGRGIDWANAEAPGHGRLALRIHTRGVSAARTAGRGTFSQRHGIVYNTSSGAPYIPLNHLDHQTAFLQIHNSLLAEAGVFGV